MYIYKINYYLSRLSGLYTEVKEPTFIDLTLFTITNKTKGGSQVSYQYYCTDLVDIDSVKDRLVLYSYFKKSLNIPAAAEKAPKKNYTINVSFSIADDGTPTDIKADTDPGFGFTEEALRMIKEMPKDVARQYNKSGAKRHTQGITFYLKENEIPIN